MENYFKQIKILFTMLLALLLIGCASTSEMERGKLSEAIRKSDDKYQGERKVADSQKRTTIGEDDDESFLCVVLSAIFSRDDNSYASRSTNNNRRTTRDRDDAVDRSSIGVSFSTGLNYSKHYSKLAGFNFRLSHEFSERKVHSLEFGFTYLPIFEDSDLYSSINHLSNLSLGYLFRYYLTPKDKSIGPYFSFRLAGKLLFWRYLNPIYTDVYDEYGEYIETETIRNDGILSLSPSIGTGVTFFQTKKLKPSIGIHAGGTLYPFKTVKSFNNDVFGYDLFVKVNLTFEFSF